MDLLYFVILTSSLIFVHELGHFLFAKAFGVKVLTFSLGFGPKILKLRGRETEYCISLLPLGGYVKMLEASKSDLVMPEDRKRTFESLPAYKRLIVILAGPVMNLVFVTDGPFPPPTVGVVLPGHPADGKLFSGDRIMAINGQEVGTFDELKRIVEKSPGETLKFKVFRGNRHVEVEVTAQERRRALQLDLVESYGTIGIQPNAPAAVIGVSSPDSPAYRAGLRTFDIVTQIAGRPIKRFSDLEAELRNNHGETVPVSYLRPERATGALGGLADMAVLEAGVVALTPNVRGGTLYERTGMELADLFAAVVPAGTYLYEAGMRRGDRVMKLDGEEIPAWSSFVERLDADRDREHQLEFISSRDGRSRTGTFRIRREDFVDGTGARFSQYVLPCGSWASVTDRGAQGCTAGMVQQWLPLALEERVDHPMPISYAFSKAVDETVDVTRFISLAFVRLAQGRLSLKEISGPITIYELAGEEGRKGPEYFIWVMALISINLGLINLFPVPVLDGGHLLFLVIEGVLRRPVPMRVREVAHIAGMAVLLLLMAVAFKNDVEKRWEVIRGQISELVG